MSRAIRQIEPEPRVMTPIERYHAEKAAKIDRRRISHVFDERGRVLWVCGCGEKWDPETGQQWCRKCEGE